MLTAYAPVPRLDWVVFVDLPLREALAPVYASLYRRCALLALGLLLAAGAGTLAGAADGGADPPAADRRGPARVPASMGSRSKSIPATKSRPWPTGSTKWRSRCRNPTKPWRPRSRREPRHCRRSEQEAREARLAAEHALAELRQAQDRLVETQKLASLGQLTAGIAHEIKNPLNFVNNFAELSGELIDELHGVLAAEDTGLPDAARSEIDDLTRMLSSNLGKIVEHGKRADSIVKNMLMHSRTGAGERRSDKLNALVEEASISLIMVRAPKIRISTSPFAGNSTPLSARSTSTRRSSRGCC